MTLSGEIRTQNAPGVLARAVANREHGDRAWAFVKEHWDEIVVAARADDARVRVGRRSVPHRARAGRGRGRVLRGAPDPAVGAPAPADPRAPARERGVPRAGDPRAHGRVLAPVPSSGSRPASSAIASRSPFAPQTTTTTCSSVRGRRRPRAAPRARPRRPAPRRAGPRARAGAAPRGSGRPRPGRRARRASTRSRTRSRPARLVPSESAAYPPYVTSTGPPAASAAVIDVLVSGSTPITRVRPSYHAPMPPISPPPPIATSTVSASGTCSESSAPIVPWPATISGWSYACITSAPLSSARAAARVERLVVVAVDDRDLGAERPDPVGLDLRRVRGHEDLGAVPERSRRVRDREPEVPARRRDDADVGNLGGQQLVERAPRLERARVLRELELQRDPPVEPERTRPELEHRRPPHVAVDPLARGLDVGSSEGHRGG